MSKYTHDKAYSFINCHKTIRKLKFLSLCTTSNFADTNQNKYQFVSRVDFGLFLKSGVCLLKYKYHQIFFWQLMEEPLGTHMSENILKYLLGGLFQSVNFWRTVYTQIYLLW